MTIAMNGMNQVELEALIAEHYREIAGLEQTVRQAQAKIKEINFKVEVDGNFASLIEQGIPEATISLLRQAKARADQVKRLREGSYFIEHAYGNLRYFVETGRLPGWSEEAMKSDGPLSAEWYLIHTAKGVLVADGADKTLALRNSVWARYAELKAILGG